MNSDYVFEITLSSGLVTVAIHDTEWDSPAIGTATSLFTDALEQFHELMRLYGFGREGHLFSLKSCRPEDLVIPLVTCQTYHKLDGLRHWKLVSGNWPEMLCEHCQFIVPYRSGSRKPNGCCKLTKQDRDHDAVCNLFDDQLFESASAAEIAQQANESATSPENDLPEPTQKQKESGNYKTGKLRIAGLNISIENPAGSKRSGVDPNGNEWSIQLQHHYGYVKGSLGKDKDHVDVFINPKASEDEIIARPIYVVDQISPETKEFDEHKVMFGFADRKAAEEAYLSNYEQGWNGLGTISEMSMNVFSAWVFNKKATKRPAGITN
jgi:hypothetical protein